MLLHTCGEPALGTLLHWAALTTLMLIPPGDHPTFGRRDGCKGGVVGIDLLNIVQLLFDLRAELAPGGIWRVHRQVLATQLSKK